MISFRVVKKAMIRVFSAPIACRVLEMISAGDLVKILERE
jgi:hypothetical protein